MASDRVDKSWQKNGLEKYSNEAILGTLAHYGIQTDEAAFRELTRDKYPLQVAAEWHEGGWKGTGQFSRFPYSAATELFRRMWPERLVPHTFAKALAELVNVLMAKVQKRSGGADAGAAFEGVQALEPKLPREPEALGNLMDEAVMQLGEEGAKAFDELAENLAKAGHKEEARRFAELEERLLPERRGVATALVRAVSGEGEAAAKDLEAILNDEGRSDESRVMALDTLIHLGAYPQATVAAQKMLDKAEQTQDFHLGLGLCERLGYLLEQMERWADLEALAGRARALADAHDAAHPHH